MVRWPGPILVATIALVADRPVGAAGLHDRATTTAEYLPNDIPANEGYAAADRHFSQARMNPELLLSKSDHDLRNPADFLVIDRSRQDHLPRAGNRPGAGITRPLGTPIEHTSIPFLISMQGTTQKMNQTYLQDRMADMLTQADEMAETIDNDGADAGVTMADGRRHHPQHGRQDEEHDARHRRICGITSPISTTSSGRSATTSTGNRTVSTSRSAGRSGRCSTLSTASTR